MGCGCVKKRHDTSKDHLKPQPKQEEKPIQEKVDDKK